MSGRPSKSSGAPAVTEHASGGADPPPDAGKDHRYLLLPVILSATFMQLIDVSIVNVAIPSIQASLRASFAAVELMVSVYLLAFAITLITGGRLGDIFGRRRLFLIGMAGFTMASAVCGAAPTAMVLVVARVFQGMFSGLMYPQVLSVIQVTFKPAERGKVFGIFGAVIGLATILGPLLGGVLIALDIAGLSWRLIFFVNLPVGIAAFTGANRALPESKAPDTPRLDLAGATLATIGLGLLVYPLVEGRQQGWPAWLDVLLALSVPALTAFAFLQRRISRRNGHPLIRWSLFHQRSFVAGSLLSLVFFLGVAPFFFVFSIYLQTGLGFSALATGLTVLPFAVGSGLASYRSAGIAKRMGKTVLSLGTGLMGLGMVFVIITIHQTGTSVNGYELIPSLLIAGVGLGLVVAPLTNIVLAGVHSVDAGSASGALSTVQQLGGAIGIALIGVVFFGLLGAHANGSAATAIPGLRAELTAAHLPPAAVTNIEQEFKTCFHARATETDPTIVPPVCQHATAAARSSEASPRVTAAIQRAVVSDAVPKAQRTNFSRSIQQTLFYEVAVCLLSCLAVFALPRTKQATAWWTAATLRRRPARSERGHGDDPSGQSTTPRHDAKQPRTEDVEQRRTRTATEPSLSGRSDGSRRNAL